MKIDAMNMIHQAAQALRANSREDDGYVYALYELANNLRLLMRGECTLEEWNKVYVGADREPFDYDTVCPVREFESGDEEEDFDDE